ncbi:hypothetical protein U0070_000055, partial [Myodes glareolus]
RKLLTPHHGLHSSGPVSLSRYPRSESSETKWQRKTFKLADSCQALGCTRVPTGVTESRKDNARVKAKGKEANQSDEEGTVAWVAVEKDMREEMGEVYDNRNRYQITICKIAVLYSAGPGLRVVLSHGLAAHLLKGPSASQNLGHTAWLGTQLSEGNPHPAHQARSLAHFTVRPGKATFCPPDRKFQGFARIRVERGEEEDRSISVPSGGSPPASLAIPSQDLLPAVRRRLSWSRIFLEGCFSAARTQRGPCHWQRAEELEALTPPSPFLEEPPSLGGALRDFALPVVRAAAAKAGHWSERLRREGTPAQRTLRVSWSPSFEDSSKMRIARLLFRRLSPDTEKQHTHKKTLDCSLTGPCGN